MKENDPFSAFYLQISFTIHLTDINNVFLKLFEIAEQRC